MTATRDTIDAALAQPTLVAAFQATAAADPDGPALRTAGVDGHLTWGDYRDRVGRIATGLHALGVRAGDAVGLLMSTRAEFHLVDTAVMHLGAAAFSIYHTNPVGQIVPLLEIARPKVVVTLPEHAATVLAAAERAGVPEHVVVVADEAAAGTTTLADVERLTADELDLDAAWRAVTPDAIAAIIFTSGTTGTPKGAEWSHGAMLASVRSLDAVAPASPHGRAVSYLPMAHLAERFYGHYCSLALGLAVTSVTDPKQLDAALPVVRPTRFFGVPRIFEKLADRVPGIVADDPALADAYAANLERVRRDGPAAVADDADARAAVRPIRAALGLDDAEVIGSGAAPAAVELLEVLAALGLTIVEIWGMSETCLALLNPPQAVRLGSVGVPAPGVEASLADDGELLIRGSIFSGYRGAPEKTREAFDEDGWLRTGDLAAVDEDGYYRIVGRKKEIIVNSAGKNIPPAMVEERVTAQTPLIGHVMAVGDRRPYLTALVVLDEEALPAFAAEHGLTGGIAELAASAPVRAEVDRAIDAGNATLARIEQIKRHRILPVHWAVGDAELTTSAKLRRHAIAERYAAEIEALYA